MKTDQVKIQVISFIAAGLFAFSACAPVPTDVEPSISPTLPEPTATFTIQPVNPILATPHPICQRMFVLHWKARRCRSWQKSSQDLLHPRLGFDEGHPGLDFSFP